MKILVANVGSTSFKFKLFDMETEEILASGKIENIGYSESKIAIQALNSEQKKTVSFNGYTDALQYCIDCLVGDDKVLKSLSELGAIGFKTVHGKGMIECRVLDDEVLQAMEDYVFLAPAHNPPYINAIKSFQSLVPEIPCVGLFEPAFHKTIPDYAYTTGIPYELEQKHSIRKYGFHGASHRFISQYAPTFAEIDPNDAKVISCHLGGSSSMCAIKNGESMDTSMSFSPQSGLLNANRCGDLDPFIPLFLQKEENLSVDEVAELLQSQGGLSGIAGGNKDVLQIELDALAGDNRAKLAMQTYCYRVKTYIGAYYAVLSGCDVVSFTGGIGEKSAPFRKEICTGLECLGIELDEELNNSVNGEAVISKSSSKVKIVVVETNEELVVAREVYKVVK